MADAFRFSMHLGSVRTRAENKHPPDISVGVSQKKSTANLRTGVHMMLRQEMPAR